MRTSLSLSLGLLLLLAAPVLQAARPLITDDARIADPGSCQLESWVRHDREGNEAWALPACNFTGNFELTAGGMIRRPHEESNFGTLLFQGKSVLRPLTTNDFGIALAGGLQTHPGKGPGHHDPYYYIPVSLSLADDRVFLHTNLGQLYLRETRQTRVTWGVGSEWVIDPRNSLIAESFGQDRGPASVQMGVRHWVRKDRFQIDATVGSTQGAIGAGRWFSLGIRLLGPAWFQ